MNDALVQVFRDGLLTRIGDASIPWDPWWWPAGDGSDPAHWGLREGDDPRVHGSLRGTGERIAGEYNAFPGSLSATQGCTWVLSTRPSSSHFPNEGCAALSVVIAELARNGHGPFHITDLVKFRGPGRDGDRGMTLELWRASLQVLEAEYAEAEPERVLMVHGARSWVNAWTLNGGFGRWCNRLGAGHLDFLRQLKSRSRVVKFWKKEDPSATASEWARVLARWP